MDNPIKSFFLFCSGATGTILKMKGCEVEHNKYTGIGVTIFFTATLATLSGGYAMFTVFHNRTASFAFGLLWGLIIFNLDRFIVSSIRKKRITANAPAAKRSMTKDNELLKALPRLLLAVFISIVITRPIELKLFEAEIQGQITKDLTQERVNLENGINAEYADVATLETEVEKLRNRQIELETERNNRIKAAAGEVDGWSGSGRPGDGPIHKQRLADVQQAEAELKTFKESYLPIIQAKDQQVTQRKTERDNRIKEAKVKIDNSGGLLKRLEALSSLMTAHLSVFLASGFIILLFISLETAPILVKLFSSRGPYDDYLDAIEHEVYANQQKAISDTNDEINTGVALSKQLNAERIQAELQLSQNTMASLQTLAPQELHDAQVKIAQKAIALWANGQLNHLYQAKPSSSNFGQPATPFVQSTSPFTAHASPQNAPQPPVPTVMQTAAGTGGGASHAGSPSNNSGATHANTATVQAAPGQATATTGNQPSSPATLAPPAQPTSPGAGQSGSPGATQSPASPNGNTPPP